MASHQCHLERVVSRERCIDMLELERTVVEIDPIAHQVRTERGNSPFRSRYLTLEVGDVDFLRRRRARDGEDGATEDGLRESCVEEQGSLQRRARSARFGWTVRQRAAVVTRQE
jgi:hypothetical protein